MGRTPLALGVAMLAVAGMMTFAPDASMAAIYTPATLSNPPDNSGGTPTNPIQSVHLNGPVGDSITVELTHNNNFITNADLSIPVYTGTVGAGTSGVSLTIPGTANGQTVTDYFYRHTDPNLGSGTIQVAAFFPNNNMQPIGTFVVTNFGNGTLSLPNFLANNQTLFYGVDLNTWAPNQTPIVIGTTYSIVNGTSSLLPGYLISNTALTVGATGWSSSSPFTGQIKLDSSVDITTVPEPSSLVLAGLGAMIVLGSRRHRRREPSPRAGAH